MRLEHTRVGSLQIFTPPEAPSPSEQVIMINYDNHNIYIYIYIYIKGFRKYPTLFLPWSGDTYMMTATRPIRFARLSITY